MILIDDFLRNFAISHCLTSKRMEKSAVKMHLEGLRAINKELALYKEDL